MGVPSLGVGPGLGLDVDLDWVGLRMGPDLGSGPLDLDLDLDLGEEGLRRSFSFRHPHLRTLPTRRRIRPRRVRTRGSSPLLRAGRRAGSGLGLERGKRRSRVGPGCDTCSVRRYSLPCRDRTLRRGRRPRLRVRVRVRVRGWVRRRWGRT